MWIMTKIGFFSIVEKSKDQMCIRSRRRQDLSALKILFGTNAEIIRTPPENSDYRFRMFLSREFFMSQLPKLVSLIDYSNFKDAVKKVNPKREKLYHKVWFDLLPIENE